MKFSKLTRATCIAALALCLSVALIPSAAVVAQNGALVYFPQGGETLEVASGGIINIQTGGAIKYNGVANTGVVKAGLTTVSAAQASANTVAITTGLTAITATQVMVLNTGNNVVTSDADITFSDGTLTVADGSTYNTVENYLIHWIAVGS